MGRKSQNIVASIFEQADIIINGTRDWDIVVHDDRLYDRLLTMGTLGMGESYMEGWWDAKKVDELIYRLVKADVQSHIKYNFPLLVSLIKGTLFNLQRWRAFEVGKKHYDISNEFYASMLDKRMIYSCAYWKNADNLDDAQRDKLDLVCQKLGLRKGQNILDVGAGWGGMLKYAAQNYGVRGLGVTVSERQVEYAKNILADLPVEVQLKDYLDVEGEFDNILSIGMFEHVGSKNYRRFFTKIAKLLKEDGLFLLHTIGGNITQNHGDPWAEKYIFPNGMLPSIRQIGQASEGLFVMEDWHNFGAYYDRTLLAWHANFEANWAKFEKQFGREFYRMWRYYLLMFAGLFRARRVQLWQIVFSKNGVEKGYKSIR